MRWQYRAVNEIAKSIVTGLALIAMRLSSFYVLMLACVSALCGACAGPDKRPTGPDASVGFKIGDRLVVHADVSLVSGKTDRPLEGYSNARFIPLNYDPDGRWGRDNRQPACWMSLHANSTFITAGSILRITKNDSFSGTRVGKFGAKYHDSKVSLYAISADKQVYSVVSCWPEEVGRFGIPNCESAHRMMTVEEVEGLVKDYVVFPDAQ